ncbi:hypothetical protein DFJ43DRAFT_305433 [Lentinula guzmanii]|uniref:Uncharacterized protein n=1 Tax=Lentinula guzmanii TaxID=2804957 RepID=A0AA38JAQ0_9AGAR|nr:hypothetical protein DFJ43DRAFT_305433 [Lentinula guzmanii]
MPSSCQTKTNPISSVAVSDFLSQIKAFASRCSLAIRKHLRTMTTPGSYKTTITSNTKATVTFTSFGIYDLEAAANRSLDMDKENISCAPLSSEVDPHAKPNTSVDDIQSMLKLSQEEPEKPLALRLEVQLAKKILSRPPSLNGPPEAPIPQKFVGRAPIVSSDVEAEASSNESVSDVGASISTDASFDSSIPSSGEDEMDEPVLRPLTVPPWHFKSRRPNVCATNIEPHPPYTALDGPMRFPF